MNVNMHIECGRVIEIKVDMIHEMMENATSCLRETASEAMKTSFCRKYEV
jgi:hypothetical protein